jgi:hypothetical protein
LAKFDDFFSVETKTREHSVVTYLSLFVCCLFLSNSYRWLA